MRRQQYAQAQNGVVYGPGHPAMGGTFSHPPYAGPGQYGGYGQTGGQPMQAIPMQYGQGGQQTTTSYAQPPPSYQTPI